MHDRHRRPPAGELFEAVALRGVSSPETLRVTMRAGTPPSILPRKRWETPVSQTLPVQIRPLQKPKRKDWN